MLTFFIIYLFCGTLIGFLAGLLGIGGGILIIPVLLFLFKLQAIPASIAMHLAVGTSLAAVVISSASSVFAHAKKGAVLFPLVKQCAPGCVLGGIFGVLIATQIHSVYLERIFGLFLVVAALNILFRVEPTTTREMPRGRFLFTSSVILGILGGLLGVGGGIFMIPFFQWCGLSMRNSIATAAACIFSLAAVATIGYILFGLSATDLPRWSTGFLYWPAFLGISLTSAIFAPFGVRAAHAMPTHLLRKIFALLLFLVAAKMLI